MIQTRQTASQDVLIVREFDAPREMLFQAWTDPEQLPLWYAPTGCTISFPLIEIREGGAFHSCIRTPDGHECWCRGTYRTIVVPERIEFTMEISNALGQSVSADDAGMDPEWPAITVLTVTFEPLGQRTRLTLHQTVDEALAKRTGAYPSWLSMLDNLEQQLKGKGF